MNTICKTCNTQYKKVKTKRTEASTWPDRNGVWYKVQKYKCKKCKYELLAVEVRN